MRSEHTFPLVVSQPEAPSALGANGVLRNSVWGLAAVFGLTGFMGYTLGPIVSHYLSMPNGHQVALIGFGRSDE